MKRPITRIVTLALFAFSALSLTACNTVQGVGQDIESIGRGIDKTSENAKRKI